LRAKKDNALVRKEVIIVSHRQCLSYFLTILLSLLALLISQHAFAEAAQISITKTSATTSYSAPNVTINYSYLVENTGKKTLTSVTVTDAHAGLSPISCPTTTLDPGQTETCTATYVTTQTDVDAGSIQNTGVATGIAAGTGNTVSDSSTLTIPGTVSQRVIQDRANSLLILINTFCFRWPVIGS
jgi:hypothetical protein